MMRRRRMGRPGLVGTMARTAVVAGTATAVAGSVQQKQVAGAQAAAQEQQVAAQSQADMADMQAQVAALQAQQAPPPPPAAAGGGDDLATQLTKLADLKAAGVLSDEEFAEAKAKLLA
jgi:Short C-terminal domain